MSRFRIVLVALIGWLFVFFNLERFDESFNIASFVYVLSAIGAAGLICVHNVTWQKTLAFAIGSIGLLLVLKWQWDYPIIGNALPITITEITTLLASFAMAHYLSLHIHRFESGSQQLFLTKSWDASSFDVLQPQMYREMNRARQFDRPVSMAFLKTDNAIVEQSVHEMIQESQRRTAQRIARAHVAELIDNSLRDCDLIARYRDGYVVLLPETTSEEADNVAELIRQSLQDKFTVDLEVGIASFPNEEITLTGLLSRAVANLHGKDESSKSTQHTATSVG